MALETINLGNYVNDGTGDDLRTAFQKINANFEELDLLGGQNNSISNVGTGIGLYKEKIGVDLKLRTLKAGTGVTIVLSNPNEITITNDRYSFGTITTDSGSISADLSVNSLSILGGTGITTSLAGNTLTIEGNDYVLSLDPTPTLGGDLNLNGYSITGTGNINISGDVTANNFFGNLNGTVYGIDVRQIDNSLNNFDFGGIVLEATNAIEWILYTTYIDMGTFLASNAVTIDGGSFV